MTKNFGLASALIILALATGCATGGNGVVPPPPAIDVEITPSTINSGSIYPTQSVTLTATVSNATTTAVTWSLSGPGTLTPVTPPTTPASAVYVAPATSGSTATVQAALTAQPTVTGSEGLTIVDITTEVAPLTPNIGTGLTQQFTAAAAPDDAPQSLTWTCTANGVPCANFVQDPNISGLATYKAQDNCSGSCIQISAASTIDPSGCSANPKFCTLAKATLVASRVSGTYAFQFSGYDSSNHATAAVGTFTAAANGTISSGVEEELTSSGWAQHNITGGSYTPVAAASPNSNNAGTLKLTGASPSQFQVVLDSEGDIEMIESDGNGSGSGIAQISAGSGAFKGAQTYAFGFTGVDANGDRVGYVGVIPMDGNGNISGGQIDVNDNGNSKNTVCSAPPCAVTGTYAPNGSGWQISLTAPIAMTFDFYIASGSTNKITPLTFYAISKNPGSNPAVSGSMVLQDSSQTYNIAAFVGDSVSALTGVNGANSNVALTFGATDGSGDFAGQFDQNNAGTILSAVQFPPASGTNNYTYSAPNGATNGRYIFNMLGNPSASTVVPPIPFVLYASGQNRGFLLDQSSSAVMTGTMNPQINAQGKAPGFLTSTELPGVFAAATTNSGTPSVDPIAANLVTTLLTPSGSAETFNVSGVEYPGSQTIAGTYNLDGVFGSGAGTIALTAPAPPSPQAYAIYSVGTSGCTGTAKNPNPVCAILSFYMIDEDAKNSDKNPSIIFAQQ